MTDEEIERTAADYIAADWQQDRYYRDMDVVGFARSLLASQAKQAVQPPEFQEVSWGVDSVMRPCKSMAISEYAFREWAKANSIVLASHAAKSTAGVNPSAPERDYCTDPDNCKRCKAATWDQPNHHHAGIPQGPQRGNAGVPEPVGINGLTEAETNATASVFGLTRDGVQGTDAARLEWVARAWGGERADFAQHVLQRGGTGDLSDIRTFIDGVDTSSGGKQ